MTRFYYHNTEGQKREAWEKVCPMDEYQGGSEKQLDHLGGSWGSTA
jgi:hypothetical protein